MAKPILQRVDAIDADKNYTFLYVWNGLTIVGSILTLTNLVTQEVITVETTGYGAFLDYEPDALTNKLKNGYKYSATIQVKYGTIASYTLSEKSDTIQFHCFETPKLTINELGTSTVTKIETASFNCNLTYTSKYSENILNTYKVEVYQDADLTVLLRSTDVLYTKGQLDKLTAYIGGLTDDTTYYIYCSGVTNYGMSVQGAVYEIVVHYDTNFDTAFTADVVDGHIELSIHEKIITGKWGVPKNALYDNKNEPNEAVVYFNNERIYFDEGVDIDNEFKLIIKCSDIKLTNSEEFLTMYSREYGSFIKLIATANIGFNEEITKGTKNIRVLCLSQNKGFVGMAYSNNMSVEVVEDALSDGFIINNELIIEVSCNKGYFNVVVKEEDNDV